MKMNEAFLTERSESKNISAGCFSHYPAVVGTENIYECNELLSKQAENDDRVYQWLVLDPRQEKLFSQIRDKISEKKVMGIKIQSFEHKYDILEYGDKDKENILSGNAKRHFARQFSKI